MLFCVNNGILIPYYLFSERSFFSHAFVPFADLGCFILYRFIRQLLRFHRIDNLYITIYHHADNLCSLRCIPQPAASPLRCADLPSGDDSRPVSGAGAVPFPLSHAAAEHTAPSGFLSAGALYPSVPADRSIALCRCSGCRIYPVSRQQKIIYFYFCSLRRTQRALSVFLTILPLQIVENPPVLRLWPLFRAQLQKTQVPAPGIGADTPFFRPAASADSFVSRLVYSCNIQIMAHRLNFLFFPAALPFTNNDKRLHSFSECSLTFVLLGGITEPFPLPSRPCGTG